MDYMLWGLLAVPIVATIAVAFFFEPARKRLGLPKLGLPKLGLSAPRTVRSKGRSAQYVVRGGQIEHVPPQPGTERAPVLLTVVRDHAVSLEDGAGTFHGFVIGPNVQQLSIGIIPRVVILTRPRFKRLSVRNIQTKEGLKVERVDFGILYQIDGDEQGGQDMPVSRPKPDALYRAAYRVAYWEEGEEKARAVESWEVAVQEMARNIIRQEVSRRLLDHLFDPKDPASAYSTIENIATANLQNIVTEWGVEIRRIQIDGIWMAEEHQQAVARQWEMQKRTEAEADRIRILEGAKRDAWRRMALDIRQALAQDEPNQAMALRLIEFLKYMDSMVELGRYPPGAMPSPAQVERMMVDSGSPRPGPAGPDRDKSEGPPKGEEPPGALPPGTPADTAR